MITFKEYLIEMPTERYAVVDKDNKSHFITPDYSAAERIAKQKGMEVHKIFAPKGHKQMDVIPIKKLRESVELEEMARKSLLQPDTSSKVLNDQELFAHIGKTKATALIKHPWFKKHFNMQSIHPNAYKVDTDKYGYPSVSVSNGFTFDHKGRKVRRMVRFDMAKDGGKVYNAHLFHNYNNERHEPQYGGGPTWNWIESHKNDE